MHRVITQDAIERVAKQAIDFMYRDINRTGFVSPQAFVDELGKNREGASLQTLEAILIDFLASAAYGEKLPNEESDRPIEQEAP